MELKQLIRDIPTGDWREKHKEMIEVFIKHARIDQTRVIDAFLKGSGGIREVWTLDNETNRITVEYFRDIKIPEGFVESEVRPPF